MRDIILFGAGQIAEVAKVYLERFSPDRLVGFTVDAAFRTAETLHGLPVVPFEELERHFPPNQVHLLGPLSYRLMNEFRRDRHNDAKARGYPFASFVHPRSEILTEAIGDNCFILESNIIQPFVTIGDGVMIWSANHIGHHCVIGDFCFLSSHVGLGGGVHLGERCFLGGKVGIESGVKVGPGAFLGGGAVVKRSVPEQGVVPGPSDRLAPYTAERIKRLRFR
jgi:sugar O-acyltransferase (sialic acid O-acetyltransferase NeuD family)